MQIPSAGTGYQTMKSQFGAENSGWRVWGSADIFKNTAFKWNTGLNFFKNKTELFSLSGSQMTVNSDVDFKPAIQAGMQQNFSYANFYLSLNGSAYFNHPVPNYKNITSSMVSLKVEKTTFINLNYLSFGYNFKDQISGKKLKDLNVSFVARNLVQEKKHVVDNTLSKTVGIALNASF